MFFRLQFAEETVHRINSLFSLHVCHDKWCRVFLLWYHMKQYTTAHAYVLDVRRDLPKIYTAALTLLSIMVVRNEEGNYAEKRINVRKEANISKNHVFLIAICLKNLYIEYKVWLSCIRVVEHKIVFYY